MKSGNVHYCYECDEEEEDCRCEPCYFCELKSVLCRDCKLDGEDVCESCCEGHDDDYDEEDEEEDEAIDEDAPVEVYIDPDQLLLPFMDTRLYMMNDIIQLVVDYMDSETGAVLIAAGSYILITDIPILEEGLSEDERVYEVKVVAPLAIPTVTHKLTRKYLGDIMPF